LGGGRSSFEPREGVSMESDEGETGEGSGEREELLELELLLGRVTPGDFVAFMAVTVVSYEEEEGERAATRRMVVEAKRKG
jgi:hypothetical protein